MNRPLMPACSSRFSRWIRLAPKRWAIVLKSMMMSARSATATRWLVAWIGPREQVAVVGDDEERDLLAQVVGIGQKELVEPRRADVQDAEAVPPPLDLKERPDLAVHQKGIAESSIGVERVEGEQPCRRVEQPVGDH